MSDTYANIAPTLTSPAMDAADVTPNDATPLQTVSRALYVGGGGDIAVEMLSGATIVFRNVPGGAILPMRARRVLATGTNATELVAMW